MLVVKKNYQVSPYLGVCQYMERVALTSRGPRLLLYLTRGLWKEQNTALCPLHVLLINGSLEQVTVSCTLVFSSVRCEKCYLAQRIISEDDMR